VSERTVERAVARSLSRARWELRTARTRIGALRHAGGREREHPSALRRELTAQHLSREDATVTKLLFDRLAPAEVAAVEQLVRDTPGAWGHFFGDAPTADNHALLLSVGMWLGADLVRERTGLVPGEPPEDVHAMSRGVLTAAGGIYEADMVIDALLSGGGDVGAVRTALDFGCSSGRVLRSLTAAYPAIAWHGCDPNRPAIEWAQANLPGASFFVNGNVPPLPLAEGALDLAYAISIWSHFEPARGLQWFEEMRRVIKPGGHLVMTTHGLTSVDHYLDTGQRSAEQSQEIAAALYTRGWWYRAEFGEQGDWGVVDPAWGTAFLSPEFLLTQLCPRWRVLEYAPGRNQDNQDVYVLQRI
jgi:SAM-dependent methyltransferase